MLIWLFKLVTDDEGENMKAVPLELLLEERAHGLAVLGGEVTDWEEVPKAPHGFQFGLSAC